MRSKRLVFGLASLGILVMAAPAALATVVLDQPLEAMVARAPVVVLGEVNQVASEWNEDHTRIYTRALITPTEVLKGSTVSVVISVKTIGGKVGNTLAELSGAPRFQVGERVLLFLEPRKDGDGYLTLGYFQGKFRVFKDASSGKELLLRDPPEKGVALVQTNHILGAEKIRTLDEVRALLRK